MFTLHVTFIGQLRGKQKKAGFPSSCYRKITRKITKKDKYSGNYKKKTTRRIGKRLVVQVVAREKLRGK